jgi:type I restriction enzyme S subunit
MVPKGWTETYLGEVITHKKGYAFNSGSYRDKGIRIVRISDTTRNSVHSENPVYLAEEDASGLENYKLTKDDIILSTVGSRPHLLDSMVGKAVKVPLEADGSLLNQNLVKVIPKASQITNEYLYEMLKNKRFIFFISTLVRGNANQVSITLSDLFQYQFVLPPLPEQKKIAQILSTWDKAITTTEQLIANSQQQKKALMQQLLTGKKRLLDQNGERFSGEWSERLLGEVSKITTGSSNRQDSHLSGAYTFFDRSEDIRTSDTYLFDCEAVIVPGEGQDFVPKYFEGKFDLHQRTYAIMDFPECYGKFLFYSIHYFRSHFLSQAVGSTVKSLRLPMFQKMKLKLPNIEEQQKIAAVLSAADQEVATLQQQQGHLKQEKKALMQQLLTGKRRVSIN